MNTPILTFSPSANLKLFLPQIGDGRALSLGIGLAYGLGLFVVMKFWTSFLIFPLSFLAAAIALSAAVTVASLAVSFTIPTAVFAAVMALAIAARSAMAGSGISMSVPSVGVSSPPSWTQPYMTAERATIEHAASKLRVSFIFFMALRLSSYLKRPQPEASLLQTS